MGLPGTATELVALVLFVVPGTVFQVIRSRLRGPTPDDQSATTKVLRAIIASLVLNAVYLILYGSQILALYERAPRPEQWVGNARQVGWWALLLLVVIPAVFALLDHLRVVYLKRVSPLRLLKVTYDPTPSAWDFAFTGREPCYLRVLTGDGRWIGGWYGEDSYVSGYPEPRDLYIDTAWLLGEQGEFESPQPDSAGLFVRCDDVRAVEFLSPPDVGVTPAAPVDHPRYSENEKGR